MNGMRMGVTTLALALTSVVIVGAMAGDDAMAASKKAKKGAKVTAKGADGGVADAGTPAKPATDAGTTAVVVSKDTGATAGSKPVYTLVSVPAPDKKVERLWKAKCASCHGLDGKADTDQGQKMKISQFPAAGWQTSRTDEQIRKSILEGIKREQNGVKQEMDAFKTDLSPEQVTALVTYVRWLGAPK